LRVKMGNSKEEFKADYKTEIVDEEFEKVIE
jgi:hypothetical protein